MTRQPTWQKDLDAFLVRHSSDRFRYGVWDCCLFVCGAIEAMTGVDPALPFRGCYKTRKEALKAVRAYAGKGTVLAVTQKVTSDWGMTPVPLLTAQRGDLVLLRRGKQDHSLGIVALCGTQIIVASRMGLTRIPLTAGVSAWRV